MILDSKPACSAVSPCGLLRPDPQSVLDTFGHRVRVICTCGHSYWRVVGSDPRETIRGEVAELVARTRHGRHGR